MSRRPPAPLNLTPLMNASARLEGGGRHASDQAIANWKKISPGVGERLTPAHDWMRSCGRSTSFTSSRRALRRRRGSSTRSTRPATTRLRRGGPTVRERQSSSMPGARRKRRPRWRQRRCAEPPNILNRATAIVRPASARALDHRERFLAGAARGGRRRIRRPAPSIMPLAFTTSSRALGGTRQRRCRRRGVSATCLSHSGRQGNPPWRRCGRWRRPAGRVAFLTACAATGRLGPSRECRLEARGA